LPEGREQALTAADGLKGGGRTARLPLFEGRNKAVRYFVVGRSALRSQPLCDSQQWQWQEIRFSRPSPAKWTNHLSLGAGELIGSTRGEWGGELVWKPTEGRAQLIIKDNVFAIEAVEGGAIVLFGNLWNLWDNGYAVRVSQRGDGGWSLSEVARLPSIADALATIGPSLFAAWSENR